jgi:ferritin
MKDLVRMRTSLSQEVAQALNAQIALEASSSAKYLAMASWCGEHGYDNCEAFFMEQSNEERNHMLKIFGYLSQQGAKAYSPEVTGISHDFNTLREVFEVSLEQEIAVTQSIHSIMDICRKTKDYTTEIFLHWFIKEQMEEEFIARKILDLYDLIGEGEQSLYVFDKHVRKVKFEETAE